MSLLRKLHIIGFWVRFVCDLVCDHDHLQVLDMESWAYQRSLVLLVETANDGSIHTVSLHYGISWVQLHGILDFCMTVVVAQAIGVTVGEVENTCRMTKNA